MQNLKVRIFRFLIWAVLMCMAALITADYEPHKVVLVPGVFLVFFVPMVMIPIRYKRQGNGPTMRWGTSLIPTIGIEKSVKLLWIAGNCLWCSMVPLLWWRGYEAQTAAQASLNMTRLMMVSGFGGLWSVAGATWLARHGKTRET